MGKENFERHRQPWRSDEARPACQRFWFAVYAPASLAYRLAVVLSIALVVGSSYFFIGVALLSVQPRC